MLRRGFQLTEDDMAKGIAHREWVISREDFTNEYGGVNEAAFRAAIEQEQALNVHIQERLGVAIVSAPIRRRGPGGTWYTVAYAFKTATVPAALDEQEPSEVEGLEQALATVPDLGDE